MLSDQEARIQRRIAALPPKSTVIEEMSWHGCLTGDCPHTYQGQCDKALADAYREIAARYPGEQAEHVVTDESRLSNVCYVLLGTREAEKMRDWINRAYATALTSKEASHFLWLIDNSSGSEDADLDPLRAKLRALAGEGVTP